ncbi:MAG: hypothetical protein OEV72_09140, partial [Thermoleophilia bacterium]|nr:hypothetical protein [Thermoleophilia bacterium]
MLAGDDELCDPVSSYVESVLRGLDVVGLVHHAGVCIAAEIEVRPRQDRQRPLHRVRAQLELPDATVHVLAVRSRRAPAQPARDSIRDRPRLAGVGHVHRPWVVAVVGDVLDTDELEDVAVVRPA